MNNLRTTEVTVPAEWLNEVITERNRLREDLHKVIYSVQNKRPGETRLETAIRYIKEREAPPMPFEMSPFYGFVDTPKESVDVPPIS